MRQLHQWLHAPDIVLIKKVKIHVMNWSEMDDKTDTKLEGALHSALPENEVITYHA
jgi:hypothetical protein